jgi:hypothetical protein
MQQGLSMGVSGGLRGYEARRQRRNKKNPTSEEAGAVFTVNSLRKHGHPEDSFFESTRSPGANSMPMIVESVLSQTEDVSVRSIQQSTNLSAFETRQVAISKVGLARTRDFTL